MPKSDLNSEKLKLLEGCDAKTFTPRPYRYKFAVKDTSRLHDAKSNLNFWFVNFGLLSCYLVCGLVIAALGASIQGIANNIGYRSTEIAAIYVSRGIGSIIGSFVSAPIFTHYNAVRSLIATYVLTIIVMVAIPSVDLMGLHVLYFAIGVLTSVISSGSILLIRKIHKGHAGPWLGALGAALVSAGIFVPWVQMMTSSLQIQFIVYGMVIFLGLIWLRCLPHIKEDINNHDCEMCYHAPTNSFVNTYVVGTRAEVCYCAGDSSDEGTEYETFFMTPVAAVSVTSSSSFYTSLSHDIDAIIHPENAEGGSARSSPDKEGSRHHHHRNSSAHYQLDGGDIEGASSGGAGENGKSRKCEEDVYSDSEGEGSVGEDMPTISRHQQDIVDGLVSPPHYWSDFIISLMVLFIIGGGSTVSIFLETYVDVTEVISSHLKEVVLMLFFISGTTANVIGIFAQINITDSSLAKCTHAVLIGGAGGMLLIICFPTSPSALWVGSMAFGFASAITVGFCFNIANRLSYPSAKSTSIIMMGSSVGVSLIPYFTSHLVIQLDCPIVVIWVGMLSLAIPVVLLFIAPRLSYLTGIHKF